MGDLRSERASLATELRLLLNALPRAERSRWSDVDRAAWVTWKEDLVRRIEHLERRLLEVHAEPTLWISGALPEIEATVEIEHSESDARSDLRVG